MDSEVSLEKLNLEKLNEENKMSKKISGIMLCLGLTHLAALPSVAQARARNDKVPVVLAAENCTGKMRALAAKIQNASPTSGGFMSREIHYFRYGSGVGDLTSCYSRTYERRYNSPQRMVDWLNQSAQDIDENFQVYGKRVQAALDKMNSLPLGTPVCAASPAMKEDLIEGAESVRHAIGAKLWSRDSYSMSYGGFYDQINNLGFLEARFIKDYAQVDSKDEATCAGVSQQVPEIRQMFAEVNRVCQSVRGKLAEASLHLNSLRDDIQSDCSGGKPTVRSSGAGVGTGSGGDAGIGTEGRQ